MLASVDLAPPVAERGSHELTLGELAVSNSVNPKGAPAFAYIGLGNGQRVLIHLENGKMEFIKGGAGSAVRPLKPGESVTLKVSE